jgi:multiple sugar transport system permease protein
MTAVQSGVGSSAAAVVAPATRAGRSRWEALRPYLFLLPFLATFLVFTVGPAVYSVWLSLFSVPLVGPRKFVGLSNFVKVFHDANFWNGVERVVIFGVVQVPVMLLIALFLALVLDLGLVRRGSGVLRLIYFIPYAIPGVISAFMWGYLYEPKFSPLDVVSQRIGLGAVNFVSSGSVLFSIGNLVTWEFVGYNVVILYVALRSNPVELIDAAVVDGAGLYSMIRHIKVPLVKVALFVTAILSVIGTMQLFTEPEIMMSFSPAINSYYTPNIDIYTTAFTEYNLNYAAAMSIVIGALTVVATAVFFGLNRLWKRIRL